MQDAVGAIASQKQCKESKGRSLAEPRCSALLTVLSHNFYEYVSPNPGENRQDIRDEKSILTNHTIDLRINN